MEVGTKPLGLDWLEALNLLARRGRYRIYEGTASRYTLARRRAKNKVAKQSRKRNRP